MGSELPYLNEDDYIEFPPVERANDLGIVAAQGNLSPGVLLSAYRQGIFPWYDEESPILWWSPDPRFILFPAELHIPKRLRRQLRSHPFDYSVDLAFSEVIGACADTPREEEEGTWIVPEMREAYTRLHELGYAHSAEVWSGGELVGGLYGVSLGGAFFGESMFTRVTDASKHAFVLFALALRDAGFHFIDSQVYTAHVARFGAREIRRAEYLQLLEEALQARTRRGSWDGWIDLEQARRRHFSPGPKQRVAGEADRGSGR
jgi:leucyl/phenylalanyl-tRNA--protein transferase